MPGLRFRSLANDADDSLFEYLKSRNVSRGFLHEIDMFLAAHPEVAESDNVLCTEFTDRFNNSTPLEAYTFFVEGYTKPARYVDGVSIQALFELCNE